MANLIIDVFADARPKLQEIANEVFRADPDGESVTNEILRRVWPPVPDEKRTSHQPAWNPSVRANGEPVPIHLRQFI
jgi:hypothetical protein